MAPGRNADTIWLALVVDDTGSVSLGLRRIWSDGDGFFSCLSLHSNDGPAAGYTCYPSPRCPCFAIPAEELLACGRRYQWSFSHGLFLVDLQRIGRECYLAVRSSCMRLTVRDTGRTVQRYCKHEMHECDSQLPTTRGTSRLR
jgi:hypothetical protein